MGLWMFCNYVGDKLICIVKLYKIFDLKYGLLIVVKLNILICKIFGGFEIDLGGCCFC